MGLAEKNAIFIKNNLIYKKFDFIIKKEKDIQDIILIDNYKRRMKKWENILIYMMKTKI